MKIGLVGLGKWGRNHERVFKELEKAGLCSLVWAKDKDFKEKMLSEVDAVSIVTSTDTHYEIAKQCLEAGKHVLVEKPITLKSAEAKELVDIAKGKNLVLAAGYLYRFNPAVIKLKEELKNVGDIHYITMRYVHSDRPPRKDMGVIFNFASHLFDILSFVLEREPREIFCKKVNYLSEEREDCALITLDYGDFIASLEVSWFHPIKARDCWVVGSKERIHTDFFSQGMNIFHVEEKEGKMAEENIEHKEPLKEELKHFIECIKERKKPANSGDAGYSVTSFCEIALESAKRSMEVTYASATI